MNQWWCPKCGMVWTAAVAPICRHNAIDVPAAVMVPLPSYHPLSVSGQGDA